MLSVLWVIAGISGLSLACTKKGVEESHDLEVAAEVAAEVAPAESAPPAKVLGDESCPAAVSSHIQSADLSSSEHSILFSWIAQRSPLECQVHAVAVVAERLSTRSDLQVVDDFCSAAATYSRFLSPEGRQHVKDAYTRIPYHHSIAMNYFNGLRHNRIDVRSQLVGAIQEDWTFEHSRRNAATWHYYLYLASFETPGAYEALAKKLRDTKSGNDLTNLIKSLAELKTQRARELLLEYRDDPRTADSPVGPGMTVSGTVKILLETLPVKRPRG